MALKYEFYNFTDETFTGRYAGVNYTFAPGETRGFDPDKHYMLLLMAKQLSDRELGKKVVGVGRDPKDMETWGKSLDSHGKPFTVTSDMRKNLMREAVGVLVDTPIPTPEMEQAEAGSTKEVSEDVKTLQDQVQALTEMIQTLSKANKTEATQSVVTPQVENTAPVGPMSMTRDVLTAMAKDLGITSTEKMTKEELIHAVSSHQAQI